MMSRRKRWKGKEGRREGEEVRVGRVERDHSTIDGMSKYTQL